MYSSFGDGASLARSSRKGSSVFLRSLRGNIFIAMSSSKKMLFGLEILDFGERDERQRLSY